MRFCDSAGLATRGTASLVFMPACIKHAVCIGLVWTDSVALVSELVVSVGSTVRPPTCPAVI